MILEPDKHFLLIASILFSEMIIFIVKHTILYMSFTIQVDSMVQWCAWVPLNCIKEHYILSIFSSHASMLHHTVISLYVVSKYWWNTNLLAKAKYFILIIQDILYKCSLQACINNAFTI